MNVQVFLRPRLVGSRFEGKAIPLEFLKDLAVLEEMIIEIAKSKFLQDNPKRQRTPRGFTEGIELKLTGIDDGSAVPIISLVASEVTLLPSQSQTYYERAREAVVAAIGAAEQRQPIIEHIPEKTLTYFDRIGRSLREGEAIEFTTPSRQAPAKLTKETRRRLVLASEKVKELTEETSVRGVVPEADQDKMTFEMQLFDGRRVRAPIAGQHLDTILDAFNGYKDGARILLQGVGRFNRHDRLLGFDSIEHVSVLDALDISARLDELRPLKNGWLEGRGVAPSQEGLDWLGHVFEQHYSEDLPLPFLYPTEAGGIRAEWSLDPYEASLDINLVDHVAEWHDLHVKTDAENSHVMNLDAAEGWQQLIVHVQRIGGDQE